MLSRSRLICSPFVFAETREPLYLFRRVALLTTDDMQELDD